MKKQAPPPAVAPEAIAIDELVGRFVRLSTSTSGVIFEGCLFRRLNAPTLDDFTMEVCDGGRSAAVINFSRDDVSGILPLHIRRGSPRWEIVLS